MLDDLSDLFNRPFTVRPKPQPAGTHAMSVVFVCCLGKKRWPLTAPALSLNPQVMSL